MQLNDSGLLRTQAFINGEWVQADDGRVFEVRNPADGRSIGCVPDLAASETRRCGWRTGGLLQDWSGRDRQGQSDRTAFAV